MLLRVANRYRAWAERSPYVANCAAGIVIASIGDMVCQKYFPHPTNGAPSSSFPTSSSSSAVSSSPSSSDGDFVGIKAIEAEKEREQRQLIVSHESKSEEGLWDWYDPVRTFNINAIRCGVITPYVLAWYPTLIRLCPGQTPLRVLGRIALDQAIGGPICVVLVFIMNSFILNLENWEQFKLRMENQFIPTWFKGFTYWPFVQIINFGFVPLVYQPLFATVCSVYWNGVISYYTSYPQDRQNEIEEKEKN